MVLPLLFELSLNSFLWVFLLYFELVLLSALLRLDVWGVGEGVSYRPHCWCCHGDAVYRSLLLKVIAQLIQSEGVNGNSPLLLF